MISIGLVSPLLAARVYLISKLIKVDEDSLQYENLYNTNNSIIHSQ
jgi:hypothetical protein